MLRRLAGFAGICLAGLGLLCLGARESPADLYRTAQLDGWKGIVFSILATTTYPGEYSEQGFWSIQRGDSTSQVLKSLGPPQTLVWVYTRCGQRELCAVYFARDGTGWRARDAADMTELEGASREEVVARFGQPREETWLYAGAVPNASYRFRSLQIANGRVVGKQHGIYVD
jgi:hypothetical protein